MSVVAGRTLAAQLPELRRGGRAAQKMLQFAIALAALASAPGSRAATPIDSALLSPDVTIELSSTVFEDEEVVVDDLLGGVVPALLGNLPNNVDLTAYHLFDSGDQLFSLDTTVELAGPLTVEPGDVVRYDGLSYTLEFDASAEGVPNGVILDAVAIAGSGDLLLSFDTMVDLGGVTAEDEDVVGFDGSDFSSFFSGSAVGLAPTLDTDAVHVFASSGNIALSFDTSGSIGGVDFDDEDVLEYDPIGMIWEMAWDASVESPEWKAGADLNAIYFVPEPGLLAMLAAGCGFLALLRVPIKNVQISAAAATTTPPTLTQKVRAAQRVLLI